MTYPVSGPLQPGTFALFQAFAPVGYGSGDQTSDWVDCRGYRQLVVLYQTGQITSGVTPVLEYSFNGSTSAGEVPGSSLGELISASDDNVRPYCWVANVKSLPAPYIRLKVAVAGTPSMSGLILAIGREHIDDHDLREDNLSPARSHPIRFIDDAFVDANS